MKRRLKRRFGQHFLRDTGTIDRIIREIGPSPNDVLVEIGAGDGALSTRLAPLVARLYAVELDRDCYEPLRTALAAYPTAQLVMGDILEIDLPSLVSGARGPGAFTAVVGNLPYCLATAIIARCLEAELAADRMVFMVQLEVAQRIAAVPGSREYGYFSVFCRHYADVRVCFRVPPACFVPRPRVHSAVVRMRPKPASLSRDVRLNFLELVKAAFAYRRKTLANALSRHPGWRDIVPSLLEAAGIDGRRRPETLAIEEYERMASVYHQRFQ